MFLKYLKAKFTYTSNSPTSETVLDFLPDANVLVRSAKLIHLETGDNQMLTAVFRVFDHTLITMVRVHFYSYSSTLILRVFKNLYSTYSLYSYSTGR